ncbi:Profilin/allergen [Calocera viscosa TUFC12733]|uniref:Profilin n=1 Tax=Calocera viscosa (strain TUFC12733) TaxID=1330018 RepID=A0A167GQD2_CALVF|nr:Profilin/allergen [Calocera viscosa TUFC12733]
MSFQAYVDVQLVGTGKITRAAIIGIAGGVWGISGGYYLTPAEQKSIISAFDTPKAVYASGLILNKRKFLATYADDQKFYGLKGGEGCVLVKTTQAVIVAEYDDPSQAAEVKVIVEKLGEYFKNIGY